MKRGLGLRLHADEEHWIPLSDLMTGLMVLFLLIAVAYMAQVELRPNPAKADAARYQATHAVAATYAQSRTDLAKELQATFAGDLKKWGADFDPNTLSLRFYGPDVLFASGSAELRPGFKAILDNFFPRYLAVLSKPRYRDLIDEIRIEGYTSTSWKPGASLNDSYLGNLALSQDRTRAVLGYVFTLPPVEPYKPWLIQVLTANGLSFSHLREKRDGTEDAYASQRVEFRVRTDSDAQMRRILSLSER
ncbi:MAG: OmpA family protein [Candidatus Eremiobacteraeota bacterium]|nr:OmpA family protein [Candidatus Eremiobacteraeota bacterium]